MTEKAKELIKDRNYLQKLRTFCAVVQAGSFTKAAKALQLSQPTASLQIQALEKRLRRALFQRRGPRIKVTPDGQAFYDLVWPVLGALDGLESTLKGGKYEFRYGRINIAAGESTILYILPRFVQEYAAKYPNVEIKLHNVTGREGLKLLRDDAVDFAVGSMIEVPDDISYHPTFTYEPMLIMPLGHPLAKLKRITIKDVAKYPLILPPHHLTTWSVVDYVFQKHGLNYRVAVEAGGWEVIKKYVENGLGISVVTSICLSGKEALVAVDMSSYFPRRSYGIVLRKDKLLSAPATCFIELVRGRAP